MDIQKHSRESDTAGRRDAGKWQGGPAPSGDRDYLALSVVVLLLVALVITGYLSLKRLSKDYDFRSESSVREWVQGLEEKAREWLEQKTKLGRGNSEREHLMEGYRLYRRKRYAGALKEFDRAVQMNESNPEAYYWRGRVLISQGRFEPAAEDFQKAVKLNPDYSEAYDSLGWLYNRLGKTDRAIDAFSKSVELRPENGWAYYQRGWIFFKKGDTDRALRDAEKACSLGLQEGCKAYEEFKSGG